MHHRTRTTTLRHTVIRSLTWLVLTSFVLVACSTPGDAALPGDATLVERAASTVIPGRFIVTVRDGVDPARVATDFGIRPDFTYRTALNGFAGSIADAARSGLMADARVLRIEPDQTVHLWATTQTGATWGIDRIDQRKGTDDTYTYEATGAGVTVYVIDTGILLSHEEFGGSRATFGFDAFGEQGEDCNGHGTHVAGTVGGTTYGVAKGVKLVAVRVLNCNGSGSWSGVVAGIDYVTDQRLLHPTVPAVANMSLGGGASSTVDDAVRASIASGVGYAVAAGNGNRGGKEQDACGYSPARVAEAITVGATTKSDSKTSWSNYGPCVNIFAPGASITSAWIGGPTEIKAISGTSMAAPHVAGVAALYLQSATGADAKAVTDALIAASTKHIVTNSKTTNNHLLYSLLGSVGATPPALQASFTFVCTDLTCDFTDTSSPTDGITAWSWSFGDGTGSSARSPEHTYGGPDSYAVRLVVTADTLSAETTQAVEVSAPASPPETGDVVLSVAGYKVKGVMHADLAWSGATSKLDVFRDGTKITTTTTVIDQGSYTDDTGLKGSASFTYQVCEEGTTEKCSNTATAVF